MPRVTLVFDGVFEPAAFAEFVNHRALTLDLRAILKEIGPERVSVALSGKPELIDAFEVACSLGPISCLVMNVARHPEREEYAP